MKPIALMEFTVMFLFFNIARFMELCSGSIVFHGDVSLKFIFALDDNISRVLPLKFWGIDQVKSLISLCPSKFSRWKAYCYGPDIFWRNQLRFRLFQNWYECFTSPLLGFIQTNFFLNLKLL